MARKSRRNNNIIEKKQEMMTPEIITGPQLETGVYARLSVEKDNEENDKLKKLNEDLKQAIKEERYEEAAKIRDEIKSMNKE